MKKRTNKDGIVYSTDPSFSFEGNQKQNETPAAHLQKLKLRLDKKQRAGKAVTLIEGFIGRTDDLEKLGKELKNYCGTGGSVKEGVIIIQGDQREKIRQLLTKKGYKII